MTPKSRSTSPAKRVVNAESKSTSRKTSPQESKGAPTPATKSRSKSSTKPIPEPQYFETPEDFRDWLRRNHLVESELLVGLHKVGTGKPSITWPQSVDEALSFGWIDGVRRSLGAESYTIRFTPRRATSIWSAVNTKRIGELIAQGRVAQAGLDAFAKRDEKKSAIYGYERGYAQFDDVSLATLKADKKAWAFYQSQAPYYRHLCAHWIGTAKRLETRARRLGELLTYSRKGERIPPLALPSANNSAAKISRAKK